jgi:DNA-binding NarL/FixJ family response regulator
MKTTRHQRSPVARRRIFILDDHPITRYGVTQLINEQPDLVVCGEAESGAEALAALKTAQPALVLVDITLPGRSGLDFIRDVQGLYPAVAVLVMSMHDENVYAERVLRAGGRGYIMKSEGGERLLEAIRQVLEGQVYVSKKMSATILDAFTRRRSVAGKARPGALSDREFEVFQLLGQGLSTRHARDWPAAQSEHQDRRHPPPSHQTEVAVADRAGTAPAGGPVGGDSAVVLTHPQPFF